MIEQSSTWSAAKFYCSQEYGTTLATITSDEDASELLSLTTSRDDAVWIGLNDRDSEGEWEWSSGYQWYDMDCILCLSLCTVRLL